MGEVIKPAFGIRPKATSAFGRVYGVVAGVEVGLLQVDTPHGTELHVAVGRPRDGFQPRPVAILLATPDGEEEAERIGLAIVQGLQIAQLDERDRE